MSPSKKSRKGGQEGDADQTQMPIKMVIPDELKLVLVEDWDNVSRQSKVGEVISHHLAALYSYCRSKASVLPLAHAGA